MMRERKGSLVDRAYHVVKSRILNGQLLPDSFVDEGALALELGTSKTPVRQALNRLATEGFIRILPQRGTLVNRMTVADIQQVYFLRAMLEPAASELAATRASAEQVKRLLELDDRFQRSDEASPDLDVHSEIHVGIARIAGVPRMTKIIAELQDQMHWYLAVRAAHGGPLPPRHHHTELINALKDGDPSRARQITSRSIEQSRDNIARIGAGAEVFAPYSAESFAWLSAR